MRDLRGFSPRKGVLGETDDEGVIAGSSNLTYSGLATNRELNLGQYDPDRVAKVREWFEELWGESSPYDLAAVFDARYQPHSPYLIYLRMLYEKYGTEGRSSRQGGPVRSPPRPLPEGRCDARPPDPRPLLRRRRGRRSWAGKTYVAGELIRQTVEDQRQRVLVVAPAALRDGPWRAFRNARLFNFEVLSFEQLAIDTQLNPETPMAARCSLTT